MAQHPEFLERLVRDHWHELHGLLTAITRDAALAEDLAQDVFVTAHRKGLTPGPGARSWLRKVARYLALNALRRRVPLPVDPAALAELAEPEGAASPQDEEEARAPAFESSLSALRACLDELPARDREVLDAKYARGADVATLARQAGQTEGYMKQRLFRLRRRLEACVRGRLRTAI